MNSFVRYLAHMLKRRREKNQIDVNKISNKDLLHKLRKLDVGLR